MVETKLPQTKLVQKIVSSIDEVKGIDVNLLDLRKINNTVYWIRHYFKIDTLIIFYSET